MRNIIVLISMVLVCSIASAKATKEDAVNLVNEAIEYYKKNGKYKAFAEISKPKGSLTKENGKLYVFVYDMNGVVVAHGQKPKEIGINKFNDKDKVDGKLYVQERIKMAKEKGEGWQDYNFMNPETKKVEPKTSFIKKHDEYIFGCGIYK